MMTEFKQSNFAGGEISPQFYARTDLPRYNSSLRKLRNWIPTIPGAAVNRPGLQFLGNTNSGLPRLLPFLYLSDQDRAYVIEIGSGFTNYFRVWYNGTVININGTGTPTVDNTAPYTSTAEVMQIKYAQVGNLLILAHPNHPVYVITRTSHNVWSIGNYSLSRTETLACSSIGIGGGWAPGGTEPTIRYAVTSVDENGNESLPVTFDSALRPSPGTGTDGTGFYTNPPNANTWVRFAWTPTVAHKLYNVYVGNSGSNVLGFFASTNDTKLLIYNTDFYTSGRINYARNPPTGETASLFNSSNNYPGVVGYFEQRLVFARTNNNPKTLWASKIGKPYDFDRQVGQPANDPIYATLASQYFDEIKSLVPRRKMFAFTAANEYTIGGGSGALSPTNIEAVPQLSEGSNAIDPLVVGRFMLHVMQRGNTVSSVGFTDEGIEVSGNNLTLLIRHLLDGYTIVDWTFARTPYEIVWIVRSDGKFLSLTYNHEQEIWGWALHNTDQATGAPGNVKAICAIPEGTEDVIYMTVERYHTQGTDSNPITPDYTVATLLGAYSIERLSTRRLTDNVSFNFLDSASFYDGQNTDPTKYIELTGLTGLTPGSTGTCLASSAIFAATNVGDEIYFNYTGYTAEVFGHSYYVGSTRMVITGYTNATTVAIQLITDLSSTYYVTSLPNPTTSDYALAVDTFGSLNRLTGNTVMALADGKVLGPFVVNVNVPIQLTLPNPAVKVWIGLPITADLELLDLAPPPKQKVKNVNKIALEVVETRGLFVGENSSLLQGWPQRTEDDNFDPEALYTGMVEIGTESTWNKEGRVLIRQSDPLPATVISVIREVTLGGGNQ